MPPSPTNPRIADTPRLRGNRWLRVRYIVVLVVLVWAGWRFWNVERPQLAELRHQQHSLQSQLTSLQGKNAKLKRQVEEFQNPQFLAQYAGAHYGEVKPGQQLFDIAPRH